MKTVDFTDSEHHCAWCGELARVRTRHLTDHDGGGGACQALTVTCTHCGLEVVALVANKYGERTLVVTLARVPYGPIRSPAGGCSACGGPTAPIVANDLLEPLLAPTPAEQERFGERFAVRGSIPTHCSRCASRA